MYKDKDKQREANAERQRRYKAKQKALLSEGVTDEALLKQGVTITKAESHVDASDISVVKALHRLIKPERTAQGNIRVSKPGDSDYEPQCETTRAFIEDCRELSTIEGGGLIKRR